VVQVGAVSGAQEQTPSLQIGLLNVRLGMPRTELQNKISGMPGGDSAVHHAGDELGQNVLVISEDLWNVGTLNGDGHAGEVWFRNNRVVYAEREWLLKDSDAVDAVLGAIDSFQHEGLHACVISHGTTTEPGETRELAWIDCGARQLLIAKTKIRDKEFKSIAESIGSIPPP
jgi:hypothetical protein